MLLLPTQDIPILSPADGSQVVELCSWGLG